MSNKLTIKETINFDTFNIDEINIYSIKITADLIPKDGIYDMNVIEGRIGQYIYAMSKCSEYLALLEHYSSFCEDKVKIEEANAMLDRATALGYKTAGEKKIYVQKDQLYLDEKAKLNKVKATILYIEGLKSSFNNAHLHCKKILDRGIKDEKFGNDAERFSSKMPTETNWTK